MTNQPTANELRALVAELKPRSPQEVMGAAASSNLMASMFTAAFTGMGLLLGGTFLMFFLGFGPDPAADSANIRIVFHVLNTFEKFPQNSSKSRIQMAKIRKMNF